MHHAVLERWSRGSSSLHRRDPRAKIVALLVFLVVVATAQRGFPALASALFLLLCAAALTARLPLGGVLLRAAVVLPFTLAFAAISWLAGDPARAVTLPAKAFLCAMAVLLTVSTTPLPSLLRGLESMRVPRFLLIVAQFLYRYLFVISEEAQHMAKAAWSRGGRGRAGFGAAAGALAVLFARSNGRAEEIHRAMLARGFTGQFRTLSAPRFRAGDALFALLASIAPVALRIALENSL